MPPPSSPWSFSSSEEPGPCCVTAHPAPSFKEISLSAPPVGEGAPLTVCLVGAGRMATVRANLMARNPRIRLKWVVDTRPEVGQALVASLPSKPSFSADLIAI